MELTALRRRNAVRQTERIQPPLQLVEPLLEEDAEE
jgi:hypothetical protein